MAVLAPERSKEGPFWLARIIEMKSAMIDSVVHIKYCAREEDYYVASTIEIIGNRRQMVPKITPRAKSQGQGHIAAAYEYRVK